MIVGIGSDLVVVQRIAESIANYGDRFKNRIFTELEQEYCNSYTGTEAVHYAARFAFKEAFSKAIGTGITKGFQFKECGLKNLPSGQPIADLRGLMLERWSQHRIHITLSHTNEHAMAVVVLEVLDEHSGAV